MFEAKIKDCKELKTVFDCISAVATETTIHVTQEGLRIKSADLGFHILLDFFIPATKFENYVVDKDMKLGINVTQFIKHLGCITDNLTIVADDNKITLKTSKKKFESRQLDIKQDDLQVQEIEFIDTIELDTELFAEALSDVSMVGALKVTFKVKDQKLLIFAKDETTAYEIILPTTSIKEIQSSFQVAYLQKILKAKSLSDKLTMGMGNDYPTKIDFKNDTVTFSAIIAPMVTEE